MVGEAVGRRPCVGGASLGGPYGGAKAHCCVAVDKLPTNTLNFCEFR